MSALGVGGTAGCLGGGGGGRTLETDTSPSFDAELSDLVLATATTAYDTGLLDELNASFSDSLGIQVKTLVQGTGAALRTAANGDADVVIAHARTSEDEFLRAGYGLNRRELMHNDFLVVGPESDPAGVASVGNDPEAAFRRIAETKSLFLSRGDDSGTHLKEQTLWARSSASPGERWYQATGDGMGDTLRQASRRDAYTLVDRGTFSVMADENTLVAYVEGPLGDGPEILRNDYGVIVSNPALHDVNYMGSMAYVGFLTGPVGQSIIRAFGEETLFVPDALDEMPPFGQYVPRD